MRLAHRPGAHLTYCLNVHPGESLADVRRHIETYSLPVRERLGIQEPFGLGLRLAAAAVRDLGEPGARAAFKRFLDERNLYAFTVNGFPYGAFHAGRVKEDVYRPDWQQAARRDYTLALANLLADLLPDGVSGSISTAPGSFKSWITTAGQVQNITQHLAECVAHLVRLERRTGREIHLGLEPEPGGLLETTTDCIEFFNARWIPQAVPLVRRALGGTVSQAEDQVRRHVGICVDTSHLAVQFEDLSESVQRLQQESIRLSKIQISAGLRVQQGRHDPAALEAFDDAVYLHQVQARAADGEQRGWIDLPDALPSLAQDTGWQEARVHFHVPLYWAGDNRLGSTAESLTDDFFARLQAGCCPHLEIETYTFDVLPPGLKAMGLVESIASEYRWVLDRFGRNGSRAPDPSN
jgi:sugar phosphate isomerase/epimerase